MIAGGIENYWQLLRIFLPTLVMMHGMTGTSDMMRPFAEKILPKGWNLLVP